MEEARVRSTRLDVVCAGVTGVRGRSTAAESLAAALARSLVAPRVLVTSDVVVAHVGALAGGPGTVVVAGTGAIALAVGRDGTTARAGGWGYLLGDDGSGFELGRRGLAAALRAFDGVPGGSGPLLDAVLRREGGAAELVDRVYGATVPASEVAAFAPAVVAAADAGDAVAAAACADAVRALHDIAAAACRAARAEDAPISWQGSVLSAERIALGFAAALAEALPSTSVRPPAGDSLDGAARLATAGNGRFLDQVVDHIA